MLRSAISAFTRVFDALWLRRDVLLSRSPCQLGPALRSSATALHRVRDTRIKRSKLFRTGIDDLPEILAVLDLLHLGGQPAVAADPVLHRNGIIGHQVGCPLRAGDLDAEGEGLVVIGLVEAEAGARRHADLV